jgi:hypothetical protein
MLGITRHIGEPDFENLLGAIHAASLAQYQSLRRRTAAGFAHNLRHPDCDYSSDPLSPSFTDKTKGNLP